MIELVDAGLLRVGGREDNLRPAGQGKSAKLFKASAHSEFDQHILRIAGQQSGTRHDAKVVLHDEYDYARVALEDLVNSVAGAMETTRFEKAKSYVFGGYDIAPTVEQRARQFLDMELNKIQNVHIREAMKFIRMTEKDQEKAYRYSVVYNLMRLSLEHGRTMRVHGCTSPFEYRGYMRMACDVADIPMESRHDGEPIPVERVESLMGLVDKLLSSEKTRKVNDLIKVHEDLGPDRHLMWKVTCGFSDPIYELKADIEGSFEDIGYVGKILGETAPKRALTLSAIALTLTSCVQAAMTGQYWLGQVVPPGLGLVLTASSLAYNYSSHKMRHYGDRGPKGSSGLHHWPFVLLYGTKTPDVKMVQQTVRRLEDWLKQERYDA